MKMLSKAQLAQSAAWVHRNARAVDLAMWRVLFENGDKNDFLRELRYYQNADGGFGNKLEPDNWNPASTGAAAEYALRLSVQAGVALGELGEIGDGIVRWLGGKDGYGEYGWQFRIPSNNDYPHAIWWSYSDKEEPEENIGLNAHLGLFALKNAPEDSVAYSRAKHELKRLMDELGKSKLGDMAANGYLSILADAPELARGSEKLILDTINGVIERDASKWSGYSKLPSDYIRSPQSPLYKGNEDIVEAELDYTIDTRPADGSWDITWQWYDGGKYAAEFEISRNWWRTQKTIEKLTFLKAFGRIED